MTRMIAHGIHFSRGSQPILRDVSLEHEAGRVLTLLGPSGSGKTTLLWILAGLLRAESGDVSYDGEGPPPRIGFVFQDGGLWEHLSVRAHLDVVLRGLRLPRAERLRRIEQTLGGTDLLRLARRRPGELSGGERQRVALARALVVEPQWLFLDEPTSQLDGATRQAMVDLLDQQLAVSRAGVVLATHQVDLAMRLSHRVAVLLDGAVAQMGCPAEVYARPTSLAVARLLGPASEICGEVSDGVLRVAQLPVLRGLPSYFRGPHRWIVRPEQVAFEPGDGPLSVAACQFAGASWHLHVTHPTAGTFVVAGRCALPVGTTGMLAWTSSDWAVPTADDASGRVSPPRA